MNKDTYNPERPPWVTAIPGKHPALLAKVTDEEIASAKRFRDEAVSLAGSHGRPMAGEKQKFLADAIDRETEQRIRLGEALQRKAGARIVLTHRRALAIALLEQGEFVKALRTVRQGKRSYPGCKDLVKTIAAWRRAVYRSDEDECKCLRETATIPDHTRQNEPDVEIELPRRNMIGWVFSPKHGCVVELWECRHCQHLNAHNLGAPEKQRHIHDARQLLHNGRAQVIKEGIPARFSDLTLHKARGNA